MTKRPSDEHCDLFEEKDGFAWVTINHEAHTKEHPLQAIFRFQYENPEHTMYFWHSDTISTCMGYRRDELLAQAFRAMESEVCVREAALLAA